jgi:hypothetical protein
LLYAAKQALGFVRWVKVKTYLSALNQSPQLGFAAIKIATKVAPYLFILPISL